MKKINWIRVINIIGVVALIIGILDPLEGSVVILAGSVLIAVSGYLSHHRFRKLYLLSSILIVIGVFFLFYLSSLGGFGGKSGLSWWYGLLVLPYPIGLITDLVLLIIGLVKKRKSGIAEK